MTYSCSAQECDAQGGKWLQSIILPVARRIGKAGEHAATAFNYNVKDRRYLTARRTDGLAWVGVYTAEAKQIFLPGSDKMRVAIHVEVLEQEAMEERMVDAVALAEGIGEKGSAPKPW